MSIAAISPRAVGAPPLTTSLVRGTRSVLARMQASNNPVIVVAVAAAIVLGVGFIAYLTAVCIGQGYRGFGAVVDIDWSGPFSANVAFTCLD